MIESGDGAEAPVEKQDQASPAGEHASPLAPVRILVAEDHADSRALMRARLSKWGYEPVVTQDGTEALAALLADDAPELAILDWSMPGMDGIEVCRRIREQKRVRYLILLTAHGSKANLIEGLTAGADDYLVKPFDNEELRARISVGLRVVSLQSALAERISELDQTAREIRRTLAEKEQLLAALEASNQEIVALRKGLVTVCAWTKRIQHDGQWITMDEFLSKHLHLNLTHGMSEEAARQVRAELAAERNAH